MPSKSMFVSIFIVITLLGMSLSAMPNNENKELEEEQTKFFSHSNVNFAGYQEDSGIPTFALIGGVAAVALVIMGVLMRPGSKPQAKKSGKKRRKMKKK